MTGLTLKELLDKIQSLVTNVDLMEPLTRIVDTAYSLGAKGDKSWASEFSQTHNPHKIGQNTAPFDGLLMDLVLYLYRENLYDLSSVEAAQAAVVHLWHLVMSKPATGYIEQDPPEVVEAMIHCWGTWLSDQDNRADFTIIVGMARKNNFLMLTPDQRSKDWVAMMAASYLLLRWIDSSEAHFQEYLPQFEERIYAKAQVAFKQRNMA